jgi:hypothetical protein
MGINNDRKELFVPNKMVLLNGCKEISNDNESAMHTIESTDFSFANWCEKETNTMMGIALYKSVTPILIGLMSLNQ